MTWEQQVCADGVPLPLRAHHHLHFPAQQAQVEAPSQHEQQDDVCPDLSPCNKPPPDYVACVGVDFGVAKPASAEVMALPRSFYSTPQARPWPSTPDSRPGVSSSFGLCTGFLAYARMQFMQFWMITQRLSLKPTILSSHHESMCTTCAPPSISEIMVWYSLTPSGRHLLCNHGKAEHWKCARDPHHPGRKQVGVHTIARLTSFIRLASARMQATGLRTQAVGPKSHCSSPTFMIPTTTTTLSPSGAWVPYVSSQRRHPVPGLQPPAP